MKVPYLGFEAPPYGGRLVTVRFRASSDVGPRGAVTFVTIYPLGVMYDPEDLVC